jgi:hypothetical protein
VQVVIFAPAKLHSGSTALQAHRHSAAGSGASIGALAVCNALIRVGAAAEENSSRAEDNMLQMFPCAKLQETLACCVRLGMCRL